MICSYSDVPGVGHALELNLVTIEKLLSLAFSHTLTVIYSTCIIGNFIVAHA